jgi:CheY-like chemotaxis protein
MPGMNGCDFARKLRNDNRYRQLKIIAVTADTESGSNFTMSLFDAVINKPLTLKQLTDTLNSLFHTH